MTGKNLERDMAALFNGRVVTMARIAAPIRKDAMIAGPFTRKELEALAESIRKDFPK